MGYVIQPLCGWISLDPVLQTGILNKFDWYFKFQGLSDHPSNIKVSSRKTNFKNFHTTGQNCNKSIGRESMRA